VILWKVSLGVVRLSPCHCPSTNTPYPLNHSSPTPNNTAGHLDELRQTHIRMDLRQQPYLTKYLIFSTFDTILTLFIRLKQVKFYIICTVYCDSIIRCRQTKLNFLKFNVISVLHYIFYSYMFRTRGLIFRNTAVTRTGTAQYVSTCMVLTYLLTYLLHCAESFLRS